MWQMYLSILPIGLGIISLVLSLICLIAYFTAHEIETKCLVLPWFQRLLLLAFILLSLGVFFTVKNFS